MGDFYGTRLEIWAGYGLVWQFLRPVFSCFHGQKKILNFLKNMVASALKCCIISFLIFFENIVDGENIFSIE